MDMSLRKLRELVTGRETWRAAVQGAAKSRTRLSDWTELNINLSAGGIYIYKKKIPLLNEFLNYAKAALCIFR